MNSITNVGLGARMINTKVGEVKDKDGKAIPVVQLVHIAPGESKDVEVLDMDDPVLKGMVATGDLVIGKPGERPPTPEEKVERDAADRVDMLNEIRKLNARLTSEATSYSDLEAQHEQLSEQLRQAAAERDVLKERLAKLPSQTEADRKSGFDEGYAKAQADAAEAAKSKK